MMRRRFRLPSPVFVMATLLAACNWQGRVTTPREELGHDFGDDYFLANYQQIADYWRRLERESERIVVQEIGTTAEGRQHLMAIVTSPINHRDLERYREISRRLALAEDLSDDEARELAREGRAVVWIDGGLHASETLGAQQLGETVFQFVSRNDDETIRILNDVIILFVHANPDGNDLVADWYMRDSVPENRRTGGYPKLYQKYIGHDNNRDFFASTQAETENINRILYHEWFPQILYNHHQSGPRGTVFWSPPLRDPYNYNLHPLIVLGFQSLGATMHSRMAAEGKGGATMRSGGPYDGWWNGGIRNTAAFHNTIALLTEMVGDPTPSSIPFVLSRQIPSMDLALPIEPQEVWHFRQSVDYSVSLNRAVLDYASRMRENLLHNRYLMGRQSIERGSTDTWTPNPRRYAEVAERVDDPDAIWAALRAPGFRDPRAFIIPADQPDFATATKFINALRETGITVHRATEDFDVGGVQYPANSYVVFTAQAFRPHVLDMFEPQVHPDVFPIPGGPPTPPYDNAGWTLAFQMGVQFDRVFDGFTGPFEAIADWNVKPPPGSITNAENATTFVTDRRANDAFIAVNRLLAAGEEVRAAAGSIVVDGTTWPAGVFQVRAGSATRARLDSLAADLGLHFIGTGQTLPNTQPLRTLRIGLWDRYGGSIDAGWARWILEQFEFPFERVFPQRLDAGNLNADFDVLVFVGGGIPGGGGRGGGGRGGVSTRGIPEEYHDQLGSVTAQSTLPQLRTFVENGGTLIAIGSSAENLARHFQLPIANHLVDNGESLPRTRFYTPGSVLLARFDTSHPAAAGMDEHTHVFFDDSPVFRLRPGAETAGVRAIGWFDTATPLRSGWSWGEHFLENGVIAVEARMGGGRVLLFTPEILKRAQPHGTFKLLFNGLIGG